MNSWLVHLNYRPEVQATEMFLIRELDHGVRQVAKPLEFNDIPRHGINQEPTLLLEHRGFGSQTHGFLQAMVDAAWGLGIRPSGVKDLDGTLEATRFHLEDMRALSGVLAKLKKDDSK